MPHATECSTNLIDTPVTSTSSPIQIPAYGRSSSSSYNTPPAANDPSDYYNTADNMNIGSYQIFPSDEATYTPTDLSRNLQPGYPRDYNCCGIDHQTLVDLLQHADNSHPGFIISVNGIFETNTVYSQDRWDSTPIHTSFDNLYPINISSIPNNKQKGTVFGHPNGYNQSGLGQLDGFNGLEDSILSQNQDPLMLYLINPLRDPNTFFGDQTLSSNPSSITSSLDDDNPLFDVPSKALHQDLHQDLSPLLSYPATPIDYISSPISSDDNSVVVVNDQTTQDNIPQRSTYGSINNKPSGTISSGTNPNKQNSYVSINNSRPNNGVHSCPPSSINSPTTGSSNADTNKTFSIAQRLPQLSTSSYSSLSSFLPTGIDSNSISQPRRSSTSTIIPSQSVATTMSQNEQQYGSIDIRPVAQLRRSSTSNLVTARTTSQAYCSIPIDKNKLAYIPPATAQFAVESYPLVGHVSPGAKYHPIQPKAGVAMSDVYSDPALDVSGKGSKKRTGLTPSADAKLTKRRVTKSSDDSITSVTETSVAVMPADLSSEAENRGETDIYPYKCIVPGCPKTYKNANGLKYHNEHGHASQSGNGAREKPWGCNIGGCLKTYGSKGGLIYHVKRCHPNDLWALP